MKIDKLIEIILKEIKQAEIIQNKKIRLIPIINIYHSVHKEEKLNMIRDYLWFNQL
ncbi:MAG TPA: hypothetical protein VGB37_14730 [Candidatus Lokiarchaeia archaeon]